MTTKEFTAALKSLFEEQNVQGAFVLFTPRNKKSKTVIFHSLDDKDLLILSKEIKEKMISKKKK